MSEVKWIKINVDMFDNEKIKIIQSMPEGDALLVVWIKLITLAGKTNDGGYIYIAENMPYTDEMLSIIMNKPINTIRLAIETFRSLQMIEYDTKGIFLLNFEKHQSLDKLAELREYNRLAKQKSRAKLKANKEVNEMSLTSQESQYTDKEKEEELEKELDKENNKYISFGEYKRIKLTQSEYNKLINDYEKEFVDKVIEKLDEYVESNNNKNKYKNFNLVIRKAIRERWFVKAIASEPGWLNEEPKAELMNDSEIEELEKQFAEFR